jgi:UDP-N-acetylglucosamine 2-epimerase (non-hydrolysing)
MRRSKIITVVGTRPEAIKMAPVIRELARRAGRFEQVVVSTGQHREMLRPIFAAFDIVPDVDLDLMQPSHGLAEFASRSMAALGALLDRLKPEAVLVQGDTTTVMAASIAAAYAKVRVGHVEAGLRSFDRLNPFPEEINRRVTSAVADFHFAPTERARANLLREGIDPDTVFVTGNTIVDALGTFRPEGAFEDPRLAAIDLTGRRLVLLTAHRRENHGQPLRGVFEAVRRLLANFPDVVVIYPVHLNPSVAGPARSALDGLGRVHLVDPVSYYDLLRLLSRCCLVLTDSGGIQEEAPSFHKPVLILREVTERPEVVEVNAGKLVGTDPERIVEAASGLLRSPAAYRAMSSATNPFGDGTAARRIVDILAQRLPGGAESESPLLGAKL